MTLPPLRLGYLVLGTRKTSAWTAFCRDMLGLPEPLENANGSVGWQLDAAAQRLVLQASAHEDLLALGLECRDPAALDALLQRARAHGLQTEPGPPALARARRVERLHLLRDPAGNAVELVTGMAPAARPFRSDAFPGGFVTGDLGLGHAVLVHRDLEAMEAFYAALGFGVTERLDTRAGPVRVRGTFLHCNRRHHSIALFHLPWRRRLHHFMLQVPDAVDVARACDRARALQVPLSLSLGQHPDDHAFSFYGRTPSGFDFEIGAGSQPIDPARHALQLADTPSSWGHAPQLSMKLRIAGALVTQRVGA